MKRRLFVFVAVALVLTGAGLLALRFLDPATPPRRSSVVDAGVATPADLGRTKEKRHVQVTAVRGKVERRVSGRHWQQAKEGDRLELSESVRTAQDGSAMLSIARSILPLKEK